ncbi:aspartyl protease AED1-like [Pistacia vera]|uniref:aspartyl protease AED1-like n=1 Tax=Pistacia vera TaxID=55513 RepID=UPI00126382CD|nr:aspartyl protease AED1-like [Pistacia vera]
MKPKKGDNGKTGLKNQISRRNLKLGIISSNKKLLVDGGVASDNEEIGSLGLMNSNDGGRIEINLSKAGLEPEHNGHEIGGGDPAYNAHGDLVTDKAYKRAAFFVNFSIGDPPFSQLALMDIGNDLVWVDCESSTAFYPPDSHTFSGYTCFDHDNVHCDTCSSANQCMFMIRYVSGDPTYGVLAIEKFTFETSDEGDRTLLEGAATPLTNYNGIYYVDLVGISLGDKRLDIDPNLFKRSTSYRKDEVAIDTGSPYTWLVSEAFYVLRAEIVEVTDGLRMRRHYDTDDWGLCYYGTGNIARDLQGYPLMTLHLGNGADLILDTTSMFSQLTARAFCLAFGPSSHYGYNYFSLIGLMAQQNHNIAYDLIGKQLYIQKIECSLLDED